MARYDGTDQGDVYIGTALADQIYGNGGDDDLSGGGSGDLIYGGEGDDHLSGGDGDDRLYGEDGHNRLEGGDGADSIYSTGIDSVDGGVGYDYWYGDYSNTTEAVTYYGDKNVFSNGIELQNIERISYAGGYGDDTFVFQSLRRSDYVFRSFDGGYGEDSLYIDGSSDRSRGQTYEFVGSESFSGLNGLFSNVENVHVIGGHGAEKFLVSATPLLYGGSIEIDGGDGVDLLDVRYDAYDSVRFVLNPDGSLEAPAGSFSNFEAFRITVGSGTNTVVLGNADDRITSLHGTSDYLDAGEGDDLVMVGGTGFTAIGGNGTDTLDIKIHKGGWFDESSGTATGGVIFHGFEHYILSGTDAAETFNICSLSVAAINPGYDPNIADILNADLSTLNHGINVSGRTYSTISELQIDSLIAHGIKYVHLIATNFDDTISDPIDSLGGGKSFIDAGMGTDTLIVSLIGGIVAPEFIVNDDGTVTTEVGIYSNFERYVVSASASDATGDVHVTTGAMDDTIALYGASGTRSVLSGMEGNDIINGGNGKDDLRGGEGNDHLSGSGGDDTLGGAAGSDLLDGGAGIDTAAYRSAERGVQVRLDYAGLQDTKGAGTDTLVSIENLTGSDHADKFNGNGLANVLDGRAGNDRLFGGAGSDVLIGGAGYDRVTGGDGADVFCFQSVADFGVVRIDEVKDFVHAQGDRIDISAIDADRHRAGNQAFTFVGAAAFATGGTEAQLRFEAVSGDHYIVQGDLNHDGVADFTFDVTSDAPLAASDFIL